MTVVENPIVVMKRVEMKYLLTPQQRQLFLEGLAGHMLPDRFGTTTIASLYYDTPDYRLISASIEKPPFKEKMRLRSYGRATDSSPVFLELKRKAEGVVYKRRVQSTIPLVEKFFAGEGDICAPGQINRELTAFRDLYASLAPACLILCERTAYCEPEGDLRLTIDENPRYRTDRLDLRAAADGVPLLPPGHSILEVKVQQAMPLWLSALLDRGKIYKTSFSKYGEAYKRQMQKYYRGGYEYV